MPPQRSPLSCWIIFYRLYREVIFVGTSLVAPKEWPVFIWQPYRNQDSALCRMEPCAEGSHEASLGSFGCYQGAAQESIRIMNRRHYYWNIFLFRNCDMKMNRWIHCLLGLLLECLHYLFLRAVPTIIV